MGESSMEAKGQDMLSMDNKDTIRKDTPRKDSITHTIKYETLIK